MPKFLKLVSINLDTIFNLSAHRGLVPAPNYLPVKLSNTTSYEYGIWNLTIHGKMITIIGIYRPPQSKKNAGIATFLDEVSDHLIEWLSNYREVIIIGDINIQDEDRNGPDKIAYNEMLASFSLQQMVTCITHESGHTLDHIILREGNNLNIEEPTQGYKISDHWMIKMTLGIDKAKKKIRKTITMHKNKNRRQTECMSELNDIISQSTNIEGMKLVEYYKTKLRELYDKWAPIEAKTVPIKIDWNG